MTLLPAYGPAGAGFQLFVQSDNDQGIYADEAARDVYFDANLTELARLDQNQYLIIKLLDGGSGSVVYQQRYSSAWVDTTSLVQGSDGGATNFSTVTTQGAFPSLSSDLTNFEESPLYYDEDGEKLVSDVALELPGGTLKLGETIDLSACTGAMIVSDSINVTTNYVLQNEFDSTGSSVPTYLNLGVESSIDIQTDFSETITTNPLTYSITGAVVAPTVRQLNTITVKTAGAITNLRARFTDTVTGNVLRYVPDKASWDSETGGLDLASGDNTFDLLAIGTDTSNYFYLGVNPVIIQESQQIDVELAADSINFFGLSSIPYMIADAQDGTYDEISSGGDVDGPSSSVDNSIALFDGVTGKLLQDSGRVLITTTTADTDLDIKAGTTSGIAKLEFQNPSGTALSFLSHDLNNEFLALDAIGNALLIDGNTIIMTADSGFIEFDNSDTLIYTMDTYHEFTNTAGDTVAVSSFFNDGVNDGRLDLHVGSRTPEGNVTNTTHALYYRQDGVNSTLYQKTTSTGNTGWATFLSTLTTPEDNSIVTFNGTSGSSVQNTQGFISDDGTNTTLDIEAAGTSGDAILTLSNDSGTPVTTLQYDAGNTETDLLLTGTLHGFQLSATGRIVVETTANESVSLINSNASLIVGGSANNYEFQYENIEPDTGCVAQFTQTGTNGGTFAIVAGTRNPEGNVTKNGGALYIRDDGTSSEIYIKRSDGVNTGWEELIHSGTAGTGDVIGPSSSTVDTVSSFADSTGKLIQEVSGFTAKTGANNTEIDIYSQSATGEAFVNLRNSSNSIVSQFKYDESGDLTTLEGDKIDILAFNTINIVSYAQNPLVIDGLFHTDADAIQTWETKDTNAGTADLHVGNRTPEGNVTASGGALYIRDDTTSSEIYIKQSEASNTEWEKLYHTGDEVLIGSGATATNLQVAYFDGTSGTLVNSDSNFRWFDGTNRLAITSDGTNACGVRIRDSGDQNIFSFDYDEVGGFCCLESTDESTPFNIIGPGGLFLTSTADEISMDNTLGSITITDTTGEISIEGPQIGLTSTSSGDITLISAGALEATSTTGWTINKTGADTVKTAAFNSNGTNGAGFDLFVGARTPEGNVTGARGDIYNNASTSGPALYYKTSASSTAGWAEFQLIKEITDVAAATYTVLTDDDYMLVSYTATAAVTITIPSALVSSGKKFVIKDSGGNAGTNNVTIETETAETIDGEASWIINIDYSSVTLISDGTNWFII